MQPDDARKKANQIKLAVVLVLIAALCIAVIVIRKVSMRSIEQATRPKFEGKLKLSRIPVTPRVEATNTSSEAIEQAAVQAGNTHAKDRRTNETSASVPASVSDDRQLDRQDSSRWPSSSVSANVSSIANLPNGTITGRVVLTGEPPPEKAIDAVLKDPGCSKLLTNTPMMTRFYVVGEADGLADVFVYLKQGVRAAPVPRSEVLINQTCCEYVPYVAGLQVGQKLLVRNSDPVLHNVHTTPTANKERNRAHMPKAADLEFVFPKPELFLRFKCDVHPWMFAYVCVVEHPYFAVTQPDGTFTIEEVPEGDYVMEAIHRKAGQVTQNISVPPVGGLQVNFELPAR